MTVASPADTQARAREQHGPGHAPVEIAVTGATGTVGRAVVDELAALGLRPRALVRSSERVADLADRAELVLGDLERPERLARLLAGVERAFVLTPLHPRQDDLQVRIVDAARLAGVTHVVKLSAWGADPAAAARIHHQHGVGDRHLERSGMGFTCLRPNAFMQNAKQWQASIARRSAIALPAGDARVSMIDARDIAAVAVRLLTAPHLENATYDLTGPQALSYAEVAESLSRAAGRTIRHDDVSPEQARDAMRAAGMPAWAVEARLELYATYRAGTAERTTTAVADLLGRRPRRFDEFAAELGPGLSH